MCKEVGHVCLFLSSFDAALQVIKEQSCVDDTNQCESGDNDKETWTVILFGQSIYLEARGFPLSSDICPGNTVYFIACSPRSYHRFSQTGFHINKVVAH